MPLPLLLAVFVAAVLSLTPAHYARWVAAAGFSAVFVPLPATGAACLAFGIACIGIPAAVTTLAATPVLLGALGTLLWRAWRGLRASDLRMLPGWCAPAHGVRWSYASSLLLLSASAVLGAYGATSTGTLSWAVVLTAAAAPRLFALLRRRDAFWQPAARLQRLQVAGLSGLAATAAVAGYFSLLAVVADPGVPEAWLITARWAQPVCALVFVCWIELPRAAALQAAGVKASPPRAPGPAL